jgi:hypothetical protein
MATLLIGRWLSVRNQTAAEESVDDHPCVEQIGKWGETGLTVFADGCRQLISNSRCVPIGPAGGNQRAAAIGKHHEQKQNAAAMKGAQDLQDAALKRMPLTQDRHRT